MLHCRVLRTRKLLPILELRPEHIFFLGKGRPGSQVPGLCCLLFSACNGVPASALKSMFKACCRCMKSAKWTNPTSCLVDCQCSRSRTRVEWTRVANFVAQFFEGALHSWVCRNARKRVTSMRDDNGRAGASVLPALVAEDWGSHALFSNCSITT